MATLKDIAETCNVSISTVSRVLKNDKVIKVNQNTRDKIFEVAAELNYRIKKVDTAGSKIAIINWYSHDQELVDPYYYYIRKSLEQECKKNQFDYTNFFYDDEIPNYQLFDSVIALGKFDQDFADKVSSKVSNIIFIGYNPDHTLYDSVEINYELLMSDIFNYAESLNVQSIGLMNGVEYINGKRFNDRRSISFKKVSTEHKIDITNYSIDGEFTMESGYEMFMRLDQEKRVPDFIICGNDMIALGANKAAYKLNYTVGKDVKIMGINNIPNAKFMVPSLTTVTVPQKQIGIEAVSLLKRRLNEKDSAPITIMIPTKLKIRKST